METAVGLRADPSTAPTRFPLGSGINGNVPTYNLVPLDRGRDPLPSGKWNQWKQVQGLVPINGIQTRFPLGSGINGNAICLSKLRLKAYGTRFPLGSGINGN